jgi:hypothetical protein
MPNRDLVEKLEMVVRPKSRWMTTAAAAGTMILALAGPAQAAPTVQALWNMDSLPTMVDSAGGDNNGTTNDVTLSGGFYSFNGTTSIASVPHKANLNPGTANIKIEVRLKVATPPKNGASYDILRKGTSSTSSGYYKLELRGTSSGMNAACIFKNANKVVATVTTAIPSKTWTTIACTKTAKTVSVAVNGSTKKTVSKTLGSLGNTSGVNIGGKGDGTDVFDGLMDKASITIG